jgi:hypothetical protein
MKTKNTTGHIKTKNFKVSNKEKILFIKIKFVYFGESKYFKIFKTYTLENYAMMSVLDAILGHKSAHTFAAISVVVEELISSLFFL